MQAQEYLAEKAYLKKQQREADKKIEGRYKEKRDALRLELKTGQEWGGVQPQPRYKPAFYEQLGQLPGSRPYLDWFQSRFPGLVSEFESMLPTYKGFKSVEGAVGETGKIESDWEKWLKGKSSTLREQWWSKRPEARGEKPWAYQPMIRTRSF